MRQLRCKGCWHFLHLLHLSFLLFLSLLCLSSIHSGILADYPLAHSTILLGRVSGPIPTSNTLRLARETILGIVTIDSRCTHDTELFVHLSLKPQLFSQIPSTLYIRLLSLLCFSWLVEESRRAYLRTLTKLLSSFISYFVVDFIVHLKACLAISLLTVHPIFNCINECAMVTLPFVLS